MTKLIYIFFIAILILPLLSATEYSNCEVYGNCKTENAKDLINRINYTQVNVNNSQYLQGYTPSTLYDYFKTMYDTVYCKLTGCTMTGNIDMNNNNISNIDYFKFNINDCANVNSSDEGVLCWNSDKKTINMVTGLGNIIQISQELSNSIKNNAGKKVYAGQILAISNSSGEMPTGDLASANTTTPELHNLAMVTIPFCNDNALCVVTQMGEVHDLDTSMFFEGEELYLSSDGSGNVTSTKQQFPNYQIHIGTVLRSHSTTGIIMFNPEVDMENGNTLHSLGVITNITAQNFIGNWSGSGDYVRISGSNMTGTLTTTSLGIGNTAPTYQLDTTGQIRSYTDSASTTGYNLILENDGAGDAMLSFLLTGATRWTMGADNTDDSIAIAQSTSLGTSDFFKILKSGYTYINTALSVNNVLVNGTVTADQYVGGRTNGMQIGMQSTGDYSMTGDFDRNEIQYATKRGIVNITLIGNTSAMVNSADNLFDSQEGNRISFRTDTGSAIITIDMLGTIPTNARAAWQPFVQFRFFNSYSHFRNISVEVSPNNIDWYSASNWHTNDSTNGGDYITDGLWMPATDGLPGTSSVRYIRFTMRHPYNTGSGTNPDTIYISEIGFRHILANYHDKYVNKQGGEDLYGTYDFHTDGSITNPTITLTSSSGQINSKVVSINTGSTPSSTQLFVNGTTTLRATADSYTVFSANNLVNQNVYSITTDGDGDGITYLRNRTGGIKQRFYSQGDSYILNDRFSIGTDTPFDIFTVKGTGTGIINIGQLSDATSYGAIGGNGRLHTTNYSLATNGSKTLLNAISDISFRITNTEIMNISSRGLNLGSNLSINTNNKITYGSSSMGVTQIFNGTNLHITNIGQANPFIFNNGNIRLVTGSPTLQLYETESGKSGYLTKVDTNNRLSLTNELTSSTVNVITSDNTYTQIGDTSLITKINGSSIRMGDDNTLTYWGTGQDAGISFDGTDMHIKSNIVGTGAIKLDSTISPTFKDGYFRFTNGASNPSYDLGQWVNINNHFIFGAWDTGKGMQLDTENGRLGIGSLVDPDTTLHVGGDAKITGNLNVTGNVHIDGNVSFKRPYMMVSSIEHQTILVANTPQVINFTNIEDDHQVYLQNAQNFSFGQSGDYLIEISAIASTDLPNKHIEIWVQKTNSSGAMVNIPRSNTKLEIPTSSIETVISVPFIIDMNMTDKFRLMWASDDAGTQLVYTTNTSYSPETPSIIMTISKVSEITD